MAAAVIMTASRSAKWTWTPSWQKLAKAAGMASLPKTKCAARPTRTASPCTLSGMQLAATIIAAARAADASAAGPGGFGGGEGDGFPRGRKFTSDDLQLLLLALLDAQPSHGYELIKALETRSNGFYSPSPGMVYPALTYLEELGYVTVQLEGNRKRYELAEPGRTHLASNRERVELMLAKLTHIARKMDSVRRAFAGEEALDPSEGRLAARTHRSAPRAQTCAAAPRQRAGRRTAPHRRDPRACHR